MSEIEVGNKVVYSVGSGKEFEVLHIEGGVAWVRTEGQSYGSLTNLAVLKRVEDLKWEIGKYYAHTSFPNDPEPWRVVHLLGNGTAVAVHARIDTPGAVKWGLMFPNDRVRYVEVPTPEYKGD